MPGQVVAEGVVVVDADGRDIPRKIASDVESNAGAATSAGEGIGRRIFGGIVAGYAAIGGTQAIFGFVSSAVTNASNLNETLSASTVIFGEQMGAMDSWASNAARTTGLSRQAALEASLGFGDMFRQLGFTGEAAAGMSREVVQAAADLGSFRNLDTADVTERISAAFRGEYDSLQAVIPNISAARVESEALARTGKTVASELTAQEKAAAVLAIVQTDGARAMGDFARTSDGAANMSKIVRAQLEEQSAAMGQRLLPAWTGFLSFVSTTAIPGLAFLSTGLGGVYDILARGDFTGAANTFGWAEDSAAVDMLFNIREGLIAIGEATAPVFGALFDAIAPLWPALSDLAGLLATAAAETGVSTWGIFLDVVSALTPIIGGLAIAVSGIVSWLGENQWLVNAVVIGITAWTVAQWALNAALTANPIGIIIVAIGALVGGIVWLATQTTFFQDVWNGAMTVIGTVATWLWENVLSPVFTAIGAVFTWLYDNIIMPIVTGIMIYIGLWAAVITWLWESVISPVFNWIGEQAQLVGLGFSILWSTYVQPAINAIGAVISWVWQSVISPVFNFIGSAAQGVGSVFAWLWNNAIMPAVNGIGSALQWVWGSIISPVFNAITGAVNWVGNSVRDVFGGIGSFIGSAFQSALNVVRGPINGIIGLVNSAIRGLNGLSVTIPDWVPIVGGQRWGLSIPTIPMLATGGMLTAGGSVMVGERGPEILNLPRGASVVPLDRAPAATAAGEKHFHLHQTIQSTDPIVGARQSAREAARFLGV